MENGILKIFGSVDVKITRLLFLTALDTILSPFDYTMILFSTNLPFYYPAELQDSF